MTTIKPNTKIRILSPEHSEYVQRLAFVSGFDWISCYGDTKVQNTEQPSLYFGQLPNGSLYIAFSSQENEHPGYFDRQADYQEIFIDLPNPSEKPNSSEWVDGLPPVGTLVDIFEAGGILAEAVEIEAYSRSKDSVFIKDGNDYNWWWIDSDTSIMPHETPEQAAKRKRDEWVKEKLEYIQNSSHALSTESEKLYMLYDMMRETGQLKELGE